MANQPHHVGFVLTSFARGGMEMRLADVVNGLDPDRYDPHIYALYDRATMQDKVVANRLHYPFSGGKYDLTPAYKLASVFRIQETKIVWSLAQGLAAGWGRLGAIMAGVPIKILSIHDNAPLYPITRLLMPFTDIVVTNSQHSANVILAQGFPSEQLRVLYNGIDTTRFKPGDDQRQNLFGTQQPIILNVGRLFPEKGRDLMLRAAVPLMQRANPPLIVFAGEGQGSQREQLEQLAQDLGIMQQVRFLGIRDDIPDLMRSADVLVMSSRNVAFGESCPNVVIEAMASELPVVGTKVGGTAELIVDGKTGFVIPPNDIEALTTQLDTLLDNADLRHHMGQAGRQRAQSQFSIDTMIAERHALFDELLHKKLYK